MYIFYTVGLFDLNKNGCFNDEVFGVDVMCSARVWPTRSDGR